MIFLQKLAIWEKKSFLPCLETFSAYKWLLGSCQAIESAAEMFAFLPK